LPTPILIIRSTVKSGITVTVHSIDAYRRRGEGAAWLVLPASLFLAARTMSPNAATVGRARFSATAVAAVAVTIIIVGLVFYFRAKLAAL
jgi:hypothetical protein